jgi:hypothetical protein
VEPVHPILGCAADVSAAVKSVAGVEPAFMSTPDKEAALVALTAARSQLEALTMRVLAAADDVAEAHGAARSADWLAAETRTTRRTARSELELGQALERHPQVATELSSGHLRSDQPRRSSKPSRPSPTGSPTRFAPRHDPSSSTWPRGTTPGTSCSSASGSST